MFKKYYPIKEIKQRDKFFSFRNFENFEKQICSFFFKLIKSYYQFINENKVNPLIFVIEDCQLIDEVYYHSI